MKGYRTKIMNTRIIRIALLFGWLSVFLSGCTDEQIVDSPDDDVSGDVVMRISLHTAGSSTETGTDVENAIRTLRVFYFNEDSTLYTTQYYETKDVMSGLPSDPKQKYDYFIKDGESYVISKLMKKEVPLKVIVVANELGSLDGITKITDIKGTVLRYYDNYYNNNKLNITITGTGNSNRGYIPMYSESAFMSVYDWDASNSKTVEMNLKRALAKVTVQIKKGTTPTDVTGNGKLEVISASISGVPQYAWLDRSDLTYRDIYVSTDTKDFSTRLTIHPSNIGNESTDMLTFYIPEHNLLGEALTNDIYTQIQVNAQFTEADGMTVTNTSYHIPLGDGIAAYNGSLIDIDALTAEDLHISKNTCYQVVASVTTTGKLERFEVKVKPEEWNTPIDIEANIGVPFLNVTSLNVDMSEKAVIVYFWTNQENPYLMEGGTKIEEGGQSSPVKVNDVFTELASPEGSTSTNFQYAALSQGGYNGFMKFIFKEDAEYLTIAAYTLTLKAGKLTRTITVNANPVIGKIVFDGNGGLFASENTYTKEVRYANLPLDGLFFGKEYEVPAPSVNAPSGGYSFFSWVYSIGERQVETKNNGNLNIVISGYVTEVKALWKK